jgi:hypothetical protein
MTSFVHVDQPTVHPGVRRAEVLFGQIQAARAGANGTRPLIALLIVAIAAAVLVVTDSLVSNWNEGGLLAVWTVFCLAAIALFALFASSVRKSSVAGLLARCAQRRAFGPRRRPLPGNREERPARDAGTASRRVAPAIARHRGRR